MALPQMSDYLKRRIVIDTPGPLIYIGNLEHFDERGYWLADADVHDRNDGHSGKEVYVNQAYELDKGGSRVINRKRVFVDRQIVASISALDEVVCTHDSADLEPWMREPEQ